MPGRYALGHREVAMTAAAINPKPGDEIRRLREERGLRKVDIEQMSDIIKLERQCSDFGITHASLTDIENDHAVPSVRKMFSLAACFNVSIESILCLYGADPAEVRNYHKEVAPDTRLEVPNSPFVLPFDSAFDLRHTGPINGDILRWPGLVPTGPDILRFNYAWVGTQDDRMGDLIPAGSLVKIDRSQTSIEVSRWRTLRDRPIYFCRTQDRYRCSWCEEADGELILLPHPASHAPSEVYKTPREAIVMGRVTFAWVPFG